MKKLDYYAWYPGHFRRDTQHLTREERHAYRDLIDEIFVTNQEDGCLPDDDVLLSRITQFPIEQWRAMRYALIDGPRPLLKKRGKKLYSARLVEEIAKAHAKSKAAHSAAGARWAERNANAYDNDANALRTQFDRNAIKNKNKKNPSGSKTKKGTSTEVPGAGEIRGALAGAGVSITKAAEKLVARWADVPGAAAVVLLLAENLDAVQSAERPLPYFRAIVNNAAKQPPKVESGEVSLDPSPEDAAEIRAFQAERERKIRLEKWDACRELGARWLETRELPPGKWSAAHNAFYHAVGVAPADYVKLRDEFAVAARQSV